MYIFSQIGENAEKLLQFKRWFWSIVEKMSMTERQDLVSCSFLVEACRTAGITFVSLLFIQCVYLQRLCMLTVRWQAMVVRIDSTLSSGNIKV